MEQQPTQASDQFASEQEIAAAVRSGRELTTQIKASLSPEDLQREAERKAVGERTWGIPPGSGAAFNGLVEGMSTMDDATDK